MGQWKRRMSECKKRGHRVIKMVCEECGQEVNRATFKAPDGWVNVKDRFPEIGKKVVITDGESLQIGWITTQDSWDYDEPPSLKFITHWMPLPPPLKDE